jgi:hypothetical protein
MLFSLAISPYRNHLAIKKRLWLIMLLIVLIPPLITVSASPPCLITTTGVSSKFGALRERFYERRIWLQVLKMLSGEKRTFRELRCSRRGYDRHMFSLQDLVHSLKGQITIFTPSLATLPPATTLRPDHVCGKLGPPVAHCRGGSATSFGDLVRLNGGAVPTSSGFPSTAIRSI